MAAVLPSRLSSDALKALAQLMSAASNIGTTSHLLQRKLNEVPSTSLGLGGTTFSHVASLIALAVCGLVAAVTDRLTAGAVTIAAAFHASAIFVIAGAIALSSMEQLSTGRVTFCFDIRAHRRICRRYQR